MSLALAASGVAALWLMWRLPDPAGYSQVGPKVVPALAGAGLLLAALVLLIESLTGGFRERAVEDVDPFNPRSVAWVGAGLAAHIALIGWIGFVPSATVLFICTARGLGSPRLGRDFFAGLALAVVLYVLFTGVLGLSLGPTPEAVLKKFL